MFRNMKEMKSSEIVLKTLPHISDSFCSFRTFSSFLSGFLYTGSYRHKYLSATQYIAPLMGDFEPEYDESSGIYYRSFGEFYFAIPVSAVLLRL